MKMIQNPQDAAEILSADIVAQDGDYDMPEMDICFNKEVYFGVGATRQPETVTVRYGRTPDGFYYRQLVGQLGVRDHIAAPLDYMAHLLFSDRTAYNYALEVKAQQALLEVHHA